MESILKDIRYGARMLVKHPGLTAISVLALTLGIGLTTTMFSIVYGALYRGLPFEEADRIMHLERNNLARDIESMEVTIHDFVDWREQQTTFEGIAGFYEGTVNVSGSEGRPDRYDGAFISANAFGLLRVQPALGRTFRTDEDSPGAELTIILGHAAWRDRYGGDPAVIGRTIRVNGEQATVIGVMPEGFAFPTSQEVWVPLRMDPLQLARGEGQTLEVVGRLKDGVTIDRAYAELAAITRRLELEYPETNEGVGPVIKPFTEEFIGDEPVTLLHTMLAAVFGVLLIACANVANLLLARATVRSKEVAIRSALGASRLRVIVQLLTETLVLAAVGGMLGLGLGWVGVRMFNRSIVDTGPPFWIDIRIDPTAVLFVVALVFVSCLVAGLIPALQASGGRVGEILKDETRGTSSMRIGVFSKGLVIAEIALSFGLLVAAGLTIKSVVKLKNIDYGFDTENVLTARVGLFEGDYPDDASRAQFFQDLQERLAGRPGVRAASLTTSLPGLGSGNQRFSREGDTFQRDQDYPLARTSVIAPGFFETFGVDILRGRDFSVQDDADALPVALVNQSFVDRFFADEDPIGRRIRLGASETDEPWLTIIGVAPDMHMGGPDNERPEGLYVPLAQNVNRFMSIAVRAEGPAMALAPMIRDEVIALDENLPIYWVRTLADAIRQGTWFYIVFGTLFMVFGGVALFLASIGLYGVMAFSVSRRTKEVGVRMALGAERGHVLGMVLRQGLLQLVIGVVLGLGLGAGLSLMLRIILFEVEPLDPTIFAAIIVVLVGTGMLATLLPARRATRVDPVIALRYE